MTRPLGNMGMVIFRARQTFQEKEEAEPKLKNEHFNQNSDSVHTVSTHSTVTDGSFGLVLLNFQNTPDDFVGGKISHFLDRWQKLISDPWSLAIIKGYNIEFETLPRQRSQPKQLVFSAEENNFVQQDMEKGIVRPALVTKNQYIHCMKIQLLTDLKGV